MKNELNFSNFSPFRSSVHPYENHLLDLHSKYIGLFLYKWNIGWVVLIWKTLERCQLRHSGNLNNRLEQIFPVVVEEHRIIWHSDLSNFNFSISDCNIGRNVSTAKSRIREPSPGDIQWHQTENVTRLLEKVGPWWYMSYYHENNSEMLVVNMNLCNWNCNISLYI